ncbi:MAG: energy transducer TonB [Candidatus Edwardsbacteria bacterium]|jgi:TonB family protein|nr:energy transducer TonB [Candidatus Edwardsbacteria bacterium]
MFTTDLILLMPVIGVATGLAVALFVVRAQELRLASVGFGVKGAKLLGPLYVKEGGMVALGIPLALVIFGSSALMLKQYLTPPPVPIQREIIPFDPTKWGLPPPIDPNGISDPGNTAIPADPNGGGIPRPVEDSHAAVDDYGTQDDWARQANAGTIDPDKLNRDSVEIVRDDLPPQGFTAMERYPELVTRIDPVYPSVDLTLGREGKVYVQLLLNTDGTVARAEIKKSSGSATLDDAAVTAVRQWVFTPAIAPGGKAVRVWQLYPVSFRIAR